MMGMIEGVRGVDRREFLRLSAIVGGAALLQACTGKGTSAATGPTITQSGPPGSLPAKANGATPVSMISSDQRVNPGKQIFSFALVEADGVTLITAPTAQVWLAQNAA